MMVRRLWEQEELPRVLAPLTNEEQQCEDLFARTHQRDGKGRFVVRLPVAESLPDFSESRSSAMRLLNHIEGWFARNARLDCLYKEFMREYDSLGHMTPATQPEGEVARRV